MMKTIRKQANSPRRAYTFLALVATIALLSACGVRKSQTVDSSAYHLEPTKQAVLSELVERGSAWTGLRASVQGRIALSKGKSFSSRMSLQAVRGEGVRLSVIPFPLVEAARLHFMPNRVVLVDVINRRYAEESYESLSAYLGFTIDYTQIEALLLGQVFVPGEGTSLKALEHLSYKPTREGGHQLAGRISSRDYEFSLSGAGALRQFEVFGTSGRKAFLASYEGEQMLGRVTFPEQTRLSLYKDKHTDTELASLELGWTKLSLVDDASSLSIAPSIKDSYKRISLEQVLEVLDKLS